VILELRKIRNLKRKFGLNEDWSQKKSKGKKENEEGPHLRRKP